MGDIYWQSFLLPTEYIFQDDCLGSEGKEVMGEPGIIISRRDKHGLGSQRESRAGILSWEMCELGVTSQDVRVNVILQIEICPL